MSETITKVGIISCSGEAIPEGTISRLATRRVLELLRPDKTVTLCLPLFLAGNEGEQDFARSHPTITIDGCSKQCAKWGTQEHSGPVSAALVVTDILGRECSDCHRSLRDASAVDREAVRAVADRIAAEVDRVLAEVVPEDYAPEGAGNVSCGCSSPIPVWTLTVSGSTVAIPGLQLIFEQCRERGVPAGEAGAADLIDAVKVYHFIAPEEEAAYRAALVSAYERFGAKAGLAQ